MALVTIWAVVNVATDPLMLLIGRALVVRMTIRAGEYEEIIGIGVAITAGIPNSRHVRTRVDGEPGVIEGRTQPGCRVVAGLAGCRELRGHVIRIGGAQIILMMAPIAVRRQGGVVVVHMTAGARHRRMESRERKAGVIVVERSRNPCARVVAHVALLGESNLHVVGVVRILEILQMAADAGSVRQLVIVVHVALAALKRRVHAGKRETGGGVIECRAQPVGGRMAAGAILREPLRRVRRVVGPVVIRLVTVPACSACQAVVVVHVALRALEAGVRPRQREPGRRMVERRARPVGDCGSVTQRAVLRKACRGVRRICGPIVVRLVAVPARRARQAVVSVHVAGDALLSGMRSDQGESGGCVIECRPAPIGGRVTAGAILREIGCLVRRVRRPVVVRLVAIPTGAVRQTVIAVDVALRALQAGMCPGQRKSCGGMIEGRAGPVRDRVPMAERAILREPGGLVRRIGRPVEVCQVAVDTGAV